MKSQEKKKLPKRNKVNPMKVLRERGAYLNEITKNLEDKGVDFFMPNQTLDISHEYLTLPTHITEVPSRELGEYLNAFTQQKLYMRTIEGYAELDAEEARRNYIDVSKEHFSMMFGTKLSETAKEREINSLSDVRPYYEAWIDAKMKVKLISSNILAIEEVLFMLSREVSRRSGDFDNERRLDNIQRR